MLECHTIQSLISIRGWKPMSTGKKWEPIDSAPRDWTDVLLFDPAYPHDHRTVFEGYFDAETEAWLSAEGETVSPTHWQPLPEPPAQGGDE
ncbi:DUF551 domain-containing protein [Sinorhizobium meliloti]|nr:DUF551 domain-containing protein [Sinorhizobium meliloti]MDW9650045.1 DUF551 domain-containing protein [Sinorhizobium meliloti]MDW9714543.1 DUF551 domain-containing protein [Sinorhizobium meliloti]MDW9739276.1 DUF551 domain-containing protein [Sinorhizobium meliloti]MDW9751758.1 DUF551 domain-containing protein [Sinorhizobium meliloti]